MKARNWFCIDATLWLISFIEDVSSDDVPREREPLEDFEILLVVVELLGERDLSRLLVFVVFDVPTVELLAIEVPRAV